MNKMLKVSALAAAIFAAPASSAQASEEQDEMCLDVPNVPISMVFCYETNKDAGIRSALRDNFAVPVNGRIEHEDGVIMDDCIVPVVMGNNNEIVVHPLAGMIARCAP